MTTSNESQKSLGFDVAPEIATLNSELKVAATLGSNDYGLLLREAHDMDDLVMIDVIAKALLGDWEARRFCLEVLQYRGHK